MEKKEILERASKIKHPVGEMEQKGINKSGWISLVCTGVLAVAFMIVEGVLGHFASIYAIASICFLWAGVFYFLQYFVAKRKFVGILIGATLESLAFVFFMTRYVLCVTGVWA